jgi:hypothetical protein
VLGWKSINVFLLSHRGWPWPKKFVQGAQGAQGMAVPQVSHSVIFHRKIVSRYFKIF